MSVMFIVGPAIFRHLPMPVSEHSRTVKVEPAKHSVLGGVPILEDVGGENDEIEITGCLYPVHFGGDGDLAALHVAARARFPLPVIRGDGVPYGWCVITSLKESHEEPQPNGAGYVIKVTVSLKRDAAPGGAGLAAILNLF